MHRTDIYPEVRFFFVQVSVCEPLFSGFGKPTVDSEMNRKFKNVVVCFRTILVKNKISVMSAEKTSDGEASLNVQRFDSSWVGSD